MNKKNENKRLGLLDVVLIVFIVSVIAISTVFFIGDNLKSTFSTYNVTISVPNISGENSLLLNEGTELNNDDGTYFGVVNDSPVFTPSSVKSENANGKLTYSYSTDGTVNVKMSISVEGKLTNYGLLLKNNCYISPNLELSLTEGNISIVAKVLSIEAIN